VVRAAIALRGDQPVDLPKKPAPLVADALAAAKWLIDDAHRLGGG
jgi:hypothetical protein